MPKESSGKYHPPGGPQKLFLSAIQSCAPEVLQALSEFIPAWRACDDQEAVTFAAAQKLDFIMSPKDQQRLDAAKESFVDPIWGWARSFRLIRPEGLPPTTFERIYCFDLFQVVRGTLRTWSESPERAASLEWGPADQPVGFENLETLNVSEISERGKVVCIGRWGDASPPESMPYHFSFSVPGWNPFSEERSEAKARMLRVVEEQIDAKLDEEKSFVESVGARPETERELASHFEWLVLYQVLGWSYERIRASEHLKRQSIEYGVKRAASILVGKSWETWIARKPGGRPKKDK